MLVLDDHNPDTTSHNDPIFGFLTMITIYLDFSIYTIEINGNFFFGKFNSNLHISLMNRENKQAIRKVQT